MKWIKVEDSLPKETGGYLCVLKMESEIEGVEDDQIYDLCTFYNQQDNYFHHRNTFRQVTHWMNLPEMPPLND
jgi:hypothetical protein